MQAQQLLQRSCASLNPGTRPTARSPTRRPEGEPKVRLRVPTPMPRREVRDALVACQDGSDHEDGRIVENSPKSKARATVVAAAFPFDTKLQVREVPQKIAVTSETRRARSGSEDAGSRVLNDITNLPQATPLDKRNEAEKSWLYCGQAVLPSSPPADIQAAQVCRSILKPESTRFAEKWMQKLLVRQYGGEDSTMGATGSDAPASSPRRVHWAEDANDAMSPPKWYLRLRSLPSRQDEDAAAKQRSKLQRPRDRRVGSSSPAALTRVACATTLNEENLNSLEAGSLAPPRWRR